MPIAILMPVFNERGALVRTLGAIAERAPELGGALVFLIDDGSEPPVESSALPGPRDGFRIVLARHVVNLGQGAALETARQLALHEPDVTAFVTMDADGQHRVEDAMALANAVLSGADVVFGNRFWGDSNTPRTRRWLLQAAQAFERALTGLELADAHNGLRAFSRRALARISIRQDRMAHATEIKQRVSRAGPLSIVELPVSVRYSSESLAKGQGSLGALVILRDLLVRYVFEEPE